MRKRIYLLLALGAAVATGADAPASGDFGWLSGHWCARSGAQSIDEYWLPAQGDIALGMSRTVKGDRTESFEFLRIERRAGITNYVAQPQGRPPTAFTLTAAGAGWARFENPQHDFPRRIEYRRSADALHAEIAGPGRDGKKTVIPFEYRACGS